MTATPTPAMDDTPTVPRPPGAVEGVAAVLIAHHASTVGPVTWCSCGEKFLFGDQHRAHVAQALVDAGCVLGDDWVVETVEQWGVLFTDGDLTHMADEREAREYVANLRTRRVYYDGDKDKLVSLTVTTATRTTAWKASDE